MSLSKTIEDPELGEIELRKYKRAKYLRIKINERGKVAISLPYHTKFDHGLAFLEEKRFWVRTQLMAHSSKLIALKNCRTKSRELELIACDISKATYRLSPSKIKVYYPKEAAISHEPSAMSDLSTEVQSIVRTAIEAALRREAHNYLPYRLRDLANQHGLSFKGISIRNTRTRWGSCSHDNNINLCMHLMKLPDELIDYVLLHELAHTVEKNHSRKFWDLLSAMLGADAKTIDKKLKRYQPEI